MDNFSAIGFRVNSGTIFPLGLPRCDIKIIFAFLFNSSFKIGIILLILDLSVIFPLTIGTFKSTRKMILLLDKFKFS